MTATVTDALVGGATVSDALTVESPWYLTGGILPAKCLVAYCPKGAATLASSYINLSSPGILDATWQSDPPTFDRSIGWTSFAETDYVGGVAILNPFPITYIWRGKILDGVGDGNRIVLNPGAFDGFFGMGLGGGDFMIGLNLTFNPAFTVAIANYLIPHTVCYQKLADNSQNLWVDGVLQAGSPKAGTAPANRWMSIVTGNSACESVALYMTDLTTAQVVAVTAKMAAL